MLILPQVIADNVGEDVEGVAQKKPQNQKFIKKYPRCASLIEFRRATPSLWPYRYFRLHAGVLEYWNRKSDVGKKPPKASFLTADLAKTERLNTTDFEVYFRCEQSNGKSTIVISCRDREDADKWIKALHTATMVQLKALLPDGWALSDPKHLSLVHFQPTDHRQFQELLDDTLLPKFSLTLNSDGFLS